MLPGPHGVQVLLGRPSAMSGPTPYDALSSVQEGLSSVQEGLSSVQEGRIERRSALGIRLRRRPAPRAPARALARACLRMLSRKDSSPAAKLSKLCPWREGTVELSFGGQAPSQGSPMAEWRPRQ